MHFTEIRQHLPPLREQAVIRNRWLLKRLDTVVPELMACHGFDCWIVAAREYNEDPTIMTLLPEPAMSARRRTILAFVRAADGAVERLTFDRYGFGDFYQRMWEPERESQWDCLSRVIAVRAPQQIGIHVSETFPFADGLTHSEYMQLSVALGPALMRRVRSAENLAVGWLERRIPEELSVYPRLAAIAHAIIARAYSRHVISPGNTTTDDVVWWMRQTMHDHGLRAWFHPTVDIQARGQRYDHRAQPRKLILPGDLLHCDMGFVALGLCTDHQQHAYVRYNGERHAPDGLRAAFRRTNRLQDIHTEEMVTGRSGNEILRRALERARREGLRPSIYSHPLGYHGHAAGPTIGLWDMQDGVPGKGDYPLYDSTCYSIELNGRSDVPEWDNQEVRIALEENAVFRNGRTEYLDGRQTELFLI